MPTRTLTRALALASATLALATAPAGAAGTQSIIGGTTAPPASWPSIVFFDVDLGNGHGIACDGTVIAPNWIVTAAHCGVDGKAAGTPNYRPDQYRVIVGRSDLRTRDGQELKVDRVIVHPKCDRTLHS